MQWDKESALSPSPPSWFPCCIGRETACQSKQTVRHLVGLTNSHSAVWGDSPIHTLQFGRIHQFTLCGLGGFTNSHSAILKNSPTHTLPSCGIHQFTLPMILHTHNSRHHPLNKQEKHCNRYKLIFAHKRFKRTLFFRTKHNMRTVLER